MLTVEEIKQALQDRLLTKVAEETGVNRNTLSHIRNGKQTNLTQNTIARLSTYLGRQNEK